MSKKNKNKHFEPYTEERAALAKKMAERVFNGEYESMEEATFFLRYVISRHYGIPIFDKYFLERSLDDLIFEAELIRLQTVPSEVQKSEIIKNNKDEASALFDDMEDDDNKEEFPDDFQNMATNFMQSNEFKE